MLDDVISETFYVGNFLDRAGAMVLKRRIEAFWRARGQSVEVRLVTAPFSNTVRLARVDVRSNMVDGMPQAERADDSA